MSLKSEILKQGREEWWFLLLRCCCCCSRCCCFSYRTLAFLPLHNSSCKHFPRSTVSVHCSLSCYVFLQCCCKRSRRHLQRPKTSSLQHIILINLFSTAFVIGAAREINVPYWKTFYLFFYEFTCHNVRFAKGRPACKQVKGSSPIYCQTKEDNAEGSDISSTKEQLHHQLSANYSRNIISPIE